MPALVGVVLSYAVLVSGVSGVGALGQVDICAPGAGTCEAPDTGTGAPDPSATYATPIEVGCNAALPPSALPGGSVTDLGHDGDLLAAGCVQPMLDFRYRVSRFADSERPHGGLGPQRGRRAARSAPTCRGMPPDHGGLTTASNPPLGVYALALLPPPKAARVFLHTEYRARTRVVEPLDRPPRA